MSSDDQAPQYVTIPAISGDWVNENGSTLKVKAEAGGILVGKFCSNVGKAKSFYHLTGRFDTLGPLDQGISLGWTVCFFNETGNSHSTSTWSGQYFDKPTPRIVTQWLLTESTDIDLVWNSTNLGHDEFTRVEDVIHSQAADTETVPRATYASNFPPTYASDA